MIHSLILWPAFSSCEYRSDLSAVHFPLNDSSASTSPLSSEVSRLPEQNLAATEATVTPNVLNTILPDGGSLVSGVGPSFRRRRWRRASARQTAPRLCEEAC